MVDDRIKSGNACVVNIFSIVQDTTFGCHTIETILLLYNSLFLATVLYNSQSWSSLSKKETEKLKICQMSFLKRIVKAPRSAPNAVVLLELGVLPIEYEIYSKKLMFLQHILKLDFTDPVRRVYYEQMNYVNEKNWANEVKYIKEQVNVNLDDETIRDMNKSMWKTRVHKAINEAAKIKLNCDCNRLKKVNRQYAELKTQEYLLKLPAENARIAFAYRSGTSDIKCDRHYMYEDLVCRACGEGEEDVNHIVNLCKETALERDNVSLDVESEKLQVISDIVDKLKTFARELTE
jgi:hypothetical protein